MRGASALCGALLIPTIYEVCNLIVYVHIHKFIITIDNGDARVYS